MTTTILIVDDEKNIRRTIRMVFEGEGYTVDEASSGEEALARLPDIAPDVILLDVQLPGVSGHDVLESMRKARAQDDEGAKAQPEPVVIKTVPSLIIVGTKTETNVPAAKPVVTSTPAPPAPAATAPPSCAPTSR